VEWYRVGEWRHERTVPRWSGDYCLPGVPLLLAVVAVLASPHIGSPRLLRARSCVSVTCFSGTVRGQQGLAHSGHPWRSNACVGCLRWRCHSDASSPGL